MIVLGFILGLLFIPIVIIISLMVSGIIHNIKEINCDHDWIDYLGSPGFAFIPGTRAYTRCSKCGKYK